MSQDNVTDLQNIMKERNEDERKVNKWKNPDKMDKMDECNTSEEQPCENEEWEKKHGSNEVKEKKNIDNGECTDRGMLDGEIGERNINDKGEVDRKRGNGKVSKVDSTGRNDEDKGNNFENIKRKSKQNVGVECVDSNDADVAENIEESVTYVDSQKLKADDLVMNKNGLVMKPVQFGNEFSVGSGIVQIAKVQNTEVTVEENGSNNNEDIVSESLIDGEIVNEIKKINDKLRCGGHRIRRFE